MLLSRRRAYAHCLIRRALGTWTRHFLVDRITEHMPDMHAKLQAGIKVADVGCGCVIVHFLRSCCYRMCCGLRAVHKKPALSE